MRSIRPRSAVIALALVSASIAGCGGDDGGDISRDDAVSALAEGLATDSGLSDTQAECLAGEIIDAVGLDRLVEAGLDSGGDIEQLDEGIQADLVTATFDAFEPCAIDITQLGE
ncbi:MAG TPA: hypothetical protein VK866_06380 [Acidimicrobiales bacterium]|nr:hypothetical protein [Acidimicrobiales bacterium]